MPVSLRKRAAFMANLNARTRVQMALQEVLQAISQEQFKGAADDETAKAKHKVKATYALQLAQQSVTLVDSALMAVVSDPGFSRGLQLCADSDLMTSAEEEALDADLISRTTAFVGALVQQQAR